MIFLLTVIDGVTALSCALALSLSGSIIVTTGGSRLLFLLPTGVIMMLMVSELRAALVRAACIDSGKAACAYKGDIQSTVIALVITNERR